MLIKNTKDLSNHKHLQSDVCVSLRHNTLSPSILAQTWPSNITGRGGSQRGGSRWGRTAQFPLLRLLLFIFFRFSSLWGHGVLFSGIFRQVLSRVGHTLWSMIVLPPGWVLYPQNLHFAFLDFLWFFSYLYWDCPAADSEAGLSVLLRRSTDCWVVSRICSLAILSARVGSRGASAKILLCCLWL